MVTYEECVEMSDEKLNDLQAELMEEHPEFETKVQDCADSFILDFPDRELFRDCVCKAIERQTEE